MEDAPYILGVLPSCIEVRAIEPRLLVQRLELPRARLLSPVVSKHGQIYAASQSHIWCLHLVPAHQQLPPLLQDKHFQLAIQLAVSKFLFFYFFMAYLYRFEIVGWLGSLLNNRCLLLYFRCRTCLRNRTIFASSKFNTYNLFTLLIYLRKIILTNLCSYFFN